MVGLKSGGPASDGNDQRCDGREPSDAAADALTAVSAYLNSLQKLLDRPELDRAELQRCLGFAKGAFRRVVDLYEADFDASESAPARPPARARDTRSE